MKAKEVTGGVENYGLQKNFHHRVSVSEAEVSLHKSKLFSTKTVQNTTRLFEMTVIFGL